jgi:DDE superfamily endonuclease
MPPEFVATMVAFQALFSKPVFERALLLVTGALLAVGARTVASALRVTGHEDDADFSAYHRVLNRARWSARGAAYQLLVQLLERFAPADPRAPLVFGLDDTIERRWGARIKARGIYRDPVRSSRGHFVKASGLRWLSLMLLSPVSWAERVWALPFLTVLCPSERYYEAKSRPAKKLTDQARGMLLLLRRWLPERRLVVACDRSFSALEFLASVRTHVTGVTRLRLDAALYEEAPARKPGQRGRTPKKGRRLPTLLAVLDDPKTLWQRLVVSEWYGKRAYQIEVATGTALWYHSGLPVVPLRWVLVRDPLGKLEPKAFLCTDQKATPLEILSWFVRRWSVEVTLEEVRRHLGVETQRQWSDRAIERTTPCLLGLFSLVTLMADRLRRGGSLPLRRSAWYEKNLPTFSDALASVRMVLWREMHSSMSGEETEMLKIPRPLYERLTNTLAYAA